MWWLRLHIGTDLVGVQLKQESQDVTGWGQRGNHHGAHWLRLFGDTPWNDCGMRNDYGIEGF